MPTTSNFGWTTPADTDLVKDGAAAIRTLGNGIDSSLIDLKGGTTGQVLSKASNTDLDYSWVTPNVGDITEVQAGTGISIASGTGPIPVVTNTVATAFDAKGDLIVGTGADTFATLTVGGTNGHLLTIDSSTATGLKWAAPAGGGKILQVVGDTASTQVSVSSTTYTDTGLEATITPAAATSKILAIYSLGCYISGAGSSLYAKFRLLRDATSVQEQVNVPGEENTSVQVVVTYAYLDSPNTTSAITYKVQQAAATASTTVAMPYSTHIATLTLLEVGA